jgi:hypothetical protein
MKKLLIFLLPLAGFLASCDDKIDLSLKTANPYLVVDGTLDDDTTTKDTVRLSSTVGYVDQSKLPPVQYAQVVLTGTDGTLDTLQEVRPGRYFVNRTWAGTPGQTYTINIKLTGGDSLRASARMPRKEMLDSITAKFREDQGPQKKGYYVGVWLTELPGKGDHFTFELVKNDTLQNLPQDLFAASDDLTDGQFIQGPELNNREGYKKGDTVSVAMCSITEDAFYFYNEVAVQANNGGLFAQPPANVRTNVANITPGSKLKPTGYFLVRTYSKKALRIK